MNKIINNNNNINVCNNCGKLGHQFNQCKLPIISYGIILFKDHTHDNHDKDFKYLMIRRKDSFGFIDFIRGKYTTYNIKQIQNIVNEMSNSEKTRLLNDNFDKLWKDMWSNTPSSHYKSEENSSLRKFENLKNGININDKITSISDIIKNSDTNWEETEWEFPKGRKNFKEKDLECALREFQEETGISSSNIKIVENILPFEETFIGTNFKAYKHKYFLAYINNDESINLNNYQKTEVSKLQWKTYDECMNSIRPYNLEKKKLITNINKVLQEYRLYS
jgi:8-oxo-dGTP pyrophosphatase MutT (NUDIX family)